MYLKNTLKLQKKKKMNNYCINEIKNKNLKINYTNFSNNIRNKIKTNETDIDIKSIYSKKSTLKIDSLNFIENIKFELEVFKEAYINQRKKYKLLKAYQNLLSGIIDEDTYDNIEDNCMITIHEHNEFISKKAIYSFLKHHGEYKDSYENDELSEILGIDYIITKKINLTLDKQKDGKKEIISK